MSIFSKVQVRKPKSSVFNLSHESKLSCNIGELIPILCQEVLPSDSFKISTELLVKLAPLKAPMMHKIKAYVHYFFVPTFQINGVFEHFINPKENSDNSIVNPWCYPKTIKGFGSVPYNAGGSTSLYNSLADYLGLPINQADWANLDGSSSGKDTKAAHILIDPFRAYQHIYNEYYRDQNLELFTGNASTETLFDVKKFKDYEGLMAFSYNGVTSAELTALFKLRKRAWAKDYFTSALPSPQAGDDVLIPINGVVQSDGAFTLSQKIDGEPDYIDNEDTGFVLSSGSPEDYGNFQVRPPIYNSSGEVIATGAENAIYRSGLKVAGGTATINDLRRAMALQRFKELAERGGTRYSEMVRNFFGAFLKDYWVDRPIFLGGMSKNITISEVLQNSATTDVSIDDETTTAFLGTRAGVGNAYGKTKTVSFKSPCHGYLMGILSLRPEAVYYQGVERMWTRQSLYDWAFPQFAKMGEQEIYQSELYATDAITNDNVFGYTPRYAEYKHGHGHIAGEFRRTLAYWTMARYFGSSPTLSKEFVMMDKVNYYPFAVTSDFSEHCYVDLYNKILARRPLPYFGNPSVI